MLLADSVDWSKALIVILTNEWHLHSYWLWAEQSCGLESGHFPLLNRLAHGGLGLEFQLVRGKAIVGESALHILTVLMQLSLLLCDSYQLAKLPEELLGADLLKAGTGLLLALGSQRLADSSILDGGICGGREGEGGVVWVAEHGS